jgi:hypothetical protein
MLTDNGKRVLQRARATIQHRWERIDPQEVARVADWLARGTPPPSRRAIRRSLEKVLGYTLKLERDLRPGLNAVPAIYAIASREIQMQRDGTVDRVRSALSELRALVESALENPTGHSSKSALNDEPTAIADLKKIIEDAGYAADGRVNGPLVGLTAIMFDACGITKNAREAVREVLAR